MAAELTYKKDSANIPQFPYGAFDITPDDDVDYITDAGFADGVNVLVKVTGDVTVTPIKGDDIVLASVPAYFVVPFRVRKIKAATTAECVGIV